MSLIQIQLIHTCWTDVRTMIVRLTSSQLFISLVFQLLLTSNVRNQCHQCPLVNRENYKKLIKTMLRKLSFCFCFSGDDNNKSLVIILVVVILILVTTIMTAFWCLHVRKLRNDPPLLNANLSSDFA